MQLLHNPRCSKSREALSELNALGHSPEVRLYLENALSADEITALLAMLDIAALDLVRQKEPLWAELCQGRVLSAAEIIEHLAAHPQLIERPVLIHQGKAAIGRPFARLLTIL
ncbi:arsenate reductase [Deefgea piscis]|uniref:Arsenate reductase n=1 Tax=Deefgea piscis TaxID=2739061 RepID=A0A6M8T0S1_9NEIS|nr:ArsC/Spx/MgsR family protein [Deefgea piscis]QKJ67607.1 arsenate reductase [Deefgea piscis]